MYFEARERRRQFLARLKGQSSLREISETEFLKAEQREKILEQESNKEDINAEEKET